MRTTITIDDDLFEALQARARERGQTVSAFVRDAVRVLLTESAAPDAPFRLVTYGRGGPAPGVDLDRTSELLAADDEATYGGS